VALTRFIGLLAGRSLTTSSRDREPAWECFECAADHISSSASGPVALIKDVLLDDKGDPVYLLACGLLIQVTDDGAPPLTSFERVIVTIKTP
jgi:hypothetical protein